MSLTLMIMTLTAKHIDMHTAPHITHYKREQGC